MTLADELREEGRKEGRKEGREEGRIEGSIQTLLQMSVSHAKIIESLVEGFNITEDQAEAYYTQYKEH